MPSYQSVRLSLASNLFNHQFDTLLHICNPFDFARGGYLCYTQTFRVSTCYFISLVWVQFDVPLAVSHVAIAHY